MGDRRSLFGGEFGLVEKVGDVVADDVWEVLGVDDPLGPDLERMNVNWFWLYMPDGVTHTCSR